MRRATYRRISPRDAFRSWHVRQTLAWARAVGIPALIVSGPVAIVTWWFLCELASR